MPTRRRRHGVAWCACLFLLVAIANAQDVGTTSADTEPGSGSTTTAPVTTAPATTTPTTTTPATTAPATTAPATTAPATTAPVTTSPATTAPATTAPATTAPSPSTATTPTSTPSTVTTAPSPSTSTTETPTSTPSSPTATTAAPVVEQYNSSTLPPGVDPSMLNGAELVTVEVTETTLGDGTTAYSYVIITRSNGTEKTIVLSPATSSDSSSGGENNTAPQSDSSLSGSTNASKKSNSIGVGAIVGIIVAAVVFMLVLFAFLIAQRQRNKHRPSDASSEDFLESPMVGKQARMLEQGQSPADTEYQEITRTTANSRSSGSSMPDGRRHRGTLWEDPVILASRIPIDRIELGSVISRGGFGEVYRGRYREQDVAIKTLLPEKRKDLSHIQAFLSEVRLIATMEHPHIVQFIGVAWESLSDLFCVTEFMAGGDLRSLLKDYLANDVPQGMDASKMQIAYQVAYALTYLHSLEPVVLHRDLKSRNILLTETLDAKLTDFGASRIRSDATMTAGVGSSLWMAPEVMMGGRYGEKADVFSLGVVISELDTHELPYSHAKESNSSSGHPLPDTAVLQMVSMGKLRVRFSPFMDPAMVRFVGSCVSLEPEQRPTAAEVLYYLQVALRNRQY